MKINLTTLLLLLTTFLLHSQDRYKTVYPIKAVLGMNIIDDSFIVNREIFDVGNKWNIAGYPSYLGCGILISDNFSLEGSVSMNKYKVGKLIDGYRLETEKEYYAIDANLKYDLSDINWNSQIIPWINPYILAGMGLTSIGEEVRPTVNFGVGTYIWFNLFSDRQLGHDFFDNTGIFIQAQGKSSFRQNVLGNQIQYSLGLVHRFL